MTFFSKLKSYIISILILCVLCIRLTGQNFITEWTVPAGNSTLTFFIETVGSTSYTWSVGVIPISGTWNGTINGSVTININTLIGGTLTLSISPVNLRRFYMLDSSGNISPDASKLKNVVQWGSVPWNSMQNMFTTCDQLIITGSPTPPNLSNVFNMAGMFEGCSMLNGPANIGTWNTSNVTNMNYLFGSAEQFNQPIGNWNTSNVTNMGGLLAGATSFNQAIGNWNTSNVTDMSGMFSSATSFNQAIGNWNTSNVSNMSKMFSSAGSFNQPIGNWNTSNVTNMGGMFWGADNFNQPLANWDVSNVTNMASMFYSANNFNQPLPNWDVSNVTNMGGMFGFTSSFNQSIADWNVSNVTIMGSMFKFAYQFNQPLGNWDVSNVTNMANMFEGASTYNHSVSNWTLNPNVNLNNIFNSSGLDCANYSTTLIGWRHFNPGVSGRSLGATGRMYGTNATAARNALINTQGWTITGDASSGSFCANCTLSATASAIHTTCGGANGSVVAQPSGSMEYTFTWSNGSNTQTINNLSGGTYIVTVTDLFGCTTTASAIVSGSTSVSVSANPVHTTCGQDNGSATATASGGSGYSHLWSNGSNSQVINNLSPGDYFVTVTSSNGCTGMANTLINTSNEISVSVSVTHESCFLCENGSATANPSGGNGYSYHWSNGSNSQVINNLSPGDYSVTVTSSLGCLAFSTITIEAYECPEIQILSTVIDPFCTNVCDGSVSVVLSGGNAPYVYQWNNGSTDSQISALCGGSYYLTVTDVNFCQKNEFFDLNEGVGLTVMLSTTHTTCGMANGNVIATPSGGTSPYVYFWSNGEITQSILNLSAGLYTLTLTSDEGCSVVQSVNVSPSSGISATISSTQVSCNSCNDGTATISPAGSTNYSFQWSNGGTTQTITNLSPGIYSATVTGNNGCTIEIFVVINDFLCPGISLEISKEDPDCFGICDGLATAMVAGGTMPYTYLWSNGATVQNLSNLCSGTYVLTFTDANQCKEIKSVTLLEGAQINTTFNTIHSTCGLNNGSITANPTGGNQYSFLWSTGDTTQFIHTLASGTYMVTITSSENCTLVSTVSVNGSNPLMVTINQTHETCENCNDGSATAITNSAESLTYLWSTGATSQNVIGLTPGSYNVTVTGGDGCIASASVVINKFGCGTIQLQSVINPIRCYGQKGKIEVMAVGGLPPYEFNWNNGDTSGQISVVAGIYSVTVSDQNSCSLISEFLLKEPDSILVLIMEESEKLIANVSGGTLPYFFIWNTGQDVKEIIPMQSGLYFVLVTDSNGCQAKSQFNYFTSTNEGILMNLKVFPNPTTSYIQIPNLNHEKRNITVYNSLGEMVVRFILTEKTEFDLSVLPGGQYYIISENKNRMSGAKVIKLE